MTTRRIQAALDVLTSEGFVIDDYRMSRHLVVKATHPAGVASVFCTSLIPSDHRTLLNFRSEVRRALKKGSSNV